MNNCSITARVLKWTSIIRFFICLVLFSSISLSSIASDALTAGEWLKKMQSAAVHENYRGTFIFSRGEMISAMSIVHRYDEGEERELLKQLDGEMGEIIRQGTQVTCVFPDNRVVKLEQTEFSNKIVQTFADFTPDQQNYHLTVQGVCRQVERPCIKLSIKANDQHRYSYFLWLDQATGLLLKSALQNNEGIELERFQYTHIEFPSTISDEELKPMNDGVLVEHQMIPSVEKDVRWPLQMMWKSEWVPPGFMKVDGNSQPGNNVLVFSDGLASYSIFIEKVDDDMMPEGASQVGATVAYTQALKLDSHQYSVTVVGEIPAMTAMMIAASIKPAMPKE